MPTPAAHEPHEYRLLAESFGADPDRYDRARPRYPVALLERIVAGLPGRRLVDAGSGTGIAARQFQALGCTVLGVEPDTRLAGFARRHGVETESATFEDWDPAGRLFDAVVAGQAWHWVDPVAGAAKAARVLRPSGRLAAFWNVTTYPDELADTLAALCERAVPDAPVSFRAMVQGGGDGYRTFYDKAADGIRTAGGFAEPEQWEYEGELACTTASWLDLMPTLGAFTRLPAAALDQVRTGARAAIDALGGHFTMRCVTGAVVATREPV